MRIFLLSRNRSNYTARRLTEVARARGHQLRLLDPMRCELALSGRQAEIYYGQKRLGRADLILPRIPHSITDYGLAVLGQFALKGIPSLNDAAGIALARNKLRCLQCLSAAGIEVPSTLMAGDAVDLKNMISLVGGAPVLVKLLQPNDRTGVMICESLQSMGAALETVLGLGHNFIVQRYLRSQQGRDLRALVVGDRVVAAVRRRPRAGRLSSSLARGARLTTILLPARQASVAFDCARVLGLLIAAVEMLEGWGRLHVLVVNGCPGLRDLEAVTGLDLATPILELGEKILSLREAPRKNIAS